MNGKIIGAIIVVVVVVGGWYVFTSKSTAPVPSQTATTTDTTQAPTETSTSTPVTVTYTDQGFSPQKVMIAKGTAVMWVNQSSGSMWVASAPHPSHQGYDGTTRTEHCLVGYTGPTPFDECANAPLNGSYTLIFDKVGTWNYDNYSGASDSGTIIVTSPATSTSITGKTTVTL